MIEGTVSLKCSRCNHCEVCKWVDLKMNGCAWFEEDQRTGRWIPVSEKPPEENKTVIASTEYGVYPEARYSKEDGWEWAYESGADYWKELEEVKAWMPLPETYEPQESEISE